MRRSDFGVFRKSSLCQSRAICVVGLSLLLSGMSSLDSSAAEKAASEAKRAAWKTPFVQGSPEPPIPFRAERVFPKLAFERPVVLTSAPGTDRFFVAEHNGKLFSIPNDQNCESPDAFLDVKDLVAQLEESSGEDLTYVATYGLTFHPDFERNRQCYVCYVVQSADKSKGQHPHGTRVVRLKVSDADPPVADPKSEQLVISWLQGGHNGGCVKFGLDGNLYISTGDGGFAFPPDGRNSGQNVGNLLSAVLRIDVDQSDGDRNYSIPDDNPFVDLKDARGEIWAYGMRNPWKMSFDRLTGDLWAGDVGWESWELVYRIQKADNYGWSLVEGRQPVHTERERGPTPIVPPVLDIPHTDGASVTGGFVYRGKKFPELVGTYIFGDWETRRIWGINADGKSIGKRRDLIEPTVRIVGFAEDNAGELYLLDYDEGTIHTPIPNDVEVPVRPFPKRLSETGLFTSVVDHQLAPGVESFAINAKLWADHAEATRFIGVPGTAGVGFRSTPEKVGGSMFSRKMEFPKNSVVAKTISLEMAAGDSDSARRVETQLLHFDGRFWRGYTYEWNEEQTDATLVADSGRSRVFDVTDVTAPGGVRHQRWKFHSRTECLRCHNPWSEHTLAFNIAQLNRRGATGDSAGNQIDELRKTGLLYDILHKADPENPYDTDGRSQPVYRLPKLTAPFGDSGTLDERARSYLHVNCAHCHQNGGGGSAYVHLKSDLSISDTKALDARPTQGTFAIHDAKILAPGDPYGSVLYYRMAKIGSGRMPHIGSSLVDEQGLRLMNEWIRQLPARPDDLKLFDQLMALDEPAALEKEAEDRATEIWKKAKQLALDREEETPSAADRKAAEEDYARQSAARTASRHGRRQKLIKDLTADPSRAMLLAESIRTGRLPDSLLEPSVSIAAKSPDPQIRDLFEIFIPDNERTKRLGEVVNPAQILAIDGNAGRGRKLFLETQGIQCRNCHKVGDKGKALGPELTLIGRKNNRAKLLESILEPSKNIDPKFATWLIETSEGRVLNGLLKSKSDDEIVLLDTQGKEIRIKADDVDQMFPQRKSLMPDLQLRDMTAEQVADLIEFLASLK